MSSSTDPNIRILKTGTCPSVSGKSKIGYQVGSDDAGNVALRISGNTGGGFFSDEWVPLAAVERALQAAKKGVSSGALRSIFRGKSVNTAGFLLAILLAEGAVQPREGKTRLYGVADFAGFVERMHTAAAANKTAVPRGRAGATPKKAIQASAQDKR